MMLFPSPFDEAVILTADGVGSGQQNSSVGKMKILSEIFSNTY